MLEEEMEWEWENFEIFNSKGITSPKKLQSDYWGIKDGEEIEESFNMSGVVVNGSRGSASDVGNNSSVSAASTESSLKEGLNGFGCFPANGTSPLEASVCSNEPFIGLKLGKRTYFENNNNHNNKTSSSSSSSSLLGIPVCLGKKVKSSSCNKTPNSRCQVEGCNLDLSSAKEYHRKHRVCETHSKSPKVIVASVERRFCQQCSRFHGMSEFDGDKRSCRKRLSDHNARRRKQQQEPIRFNSSFYDTHMIQSTNNPSKYCMAQVKAEKFVDNDVMPVPPRGCRGVIFDEGFKESLDSVDLHRALSLLSNNSCDQNSISFQNPMNSSMPQHEFVPQAESWQIFKSPSSYENSFLFHPNGYHSHSPL